MLIRVLFLEFALILGEVVIVMTKCDIAFLWLAWVPLCQFAGATMCGIVIWHHPKFASLCATFF